MRKSFYALLVLFSCASVFAQTVLKEPISLSTVTTTKPTFKWAKTTAATDGYEFCLLTLAADTSNTAIPLAAHVGKWARYVRVGTSASDTSYTIDSALARTTGTYYWKVRSKTATGFGGWVYANGKFKIGTPVSMILTSKAAITFDHDVTSAIRQITFVDGSNTKILDSTYNTSKVTGLGGTNLANALGSRDTLVSWSTNGSDTNTFSYENYAKYGNTGKKVLTVAYGATGITVDIATTLETGKTLYMAAAWKPGGTVDANDNVVIVDNLTSSKVTYPTAIASKADADSIMVRGMYDASYKEYFGFKSTSAIAVADTQSTGFLKQSFKMVNAAGSNTVYTVSFAVRKTRNEFFNIWADNRPMFVSSVTATSADTLVRGLNYIKWETFGASPDTLKYSDNGTAYTKTFILGKDTSSYLDSVQVRIPNGVYGATSVVKLISDSGDVALSDAFKVSARYVTVTDPKTGDSFVPDSQKVTWTNATGVALTKIEVSTDSGATWGSTKTISSLLAKDTSYFNFNGKSTKCFVRVFNAVGDTGISDQFTLLRYITVSKPTTGNTIPAGTSANIVWDNYTGITVTKVTISLDSGATWLDPVTISSTKTADSLSYLFEGTKTNCANVFARVMTTANADTGKSARFTVASGGATFTLTPSFGDPAGSVSVPVTFVDGVAGDSLKAFDFLVTFDSSIVHYHDYTLDAKVGSGKWLVAVDSMHKSGSNSYVRVSGFKLPAGAGVKSGELMQLEFTINNNQANIGSTAVLDITNGVLSAAGNNALALSTSTTVNGSIAVYSSVEGYLRYFHKKWIASSSYTISGDSLVSYVDKAKSVNDAVYGTTAGYYKMSSREPNDTIVVTPFASKYMATGLAAIDVADAQLAFRDWTDTLQIRQRITADVNGDSLINTTDAMAIMEASVDSTYFTRVEQTNWIFVDSTSLAGYESCADSLTNWYKLQKHSITSKLTNQQTNQNFFGVLRGDVNFSFNAAAIRTMKKSSAAPVVLSTSDKVNARPGDTVWIPLNMTLNGEAIGGFNSTLQVDPATFTYTGQYKVGTIPQGKNWYITAKADAKGLLRVAGTDFSFKINPIVQDGPALLFKYVVNKTAKKGVVTEIEVNASTVIDNNLENIESAVKNGQAEISRMGSTVVTEYELAQNYPNPFNPTTTIEFALPMDSKVDINIYNILGQQVKTLFTGVQTVGYHQVEFNASQMSSGIYFYTIKASSLAGDRNFSSVKKMMLVK